ncbi:hypothetical protein DFH06DRAFT_1304913 [Mycena polygramma]|nr:hypothetical protein DFH06DRAFT_1304913 [Mycena polygramma]
MWKRYHSLGAHAVAQSKCGEELVEKATKKWHVDLEQKAKAPPDLRKVAIFLPSGKAGIKVAWRAGRASPSPKVLQVPLWSTIMRLGVYYLSMAMLGLIGMFFGIAIVRLIFASSAPAPGYGCSQNSSDLICPRTRTGAHSSKKWTIPHLAPAEPSRADRGGGGRIERHSVVVHRRVHSIH